MSISSKLVDRCQGLCELCTEGDASHAYAVSPKNNDTIENEVALCNNCFLAIEGGGDANRWQSLAGSIWNMEPSVQALSYRILYGIKDIEWANDLMNSVDFEESVLDWAISSFEKKDIHVDAFGNELLNGDTVVLTQALNVKGTSFSAPKGTVVKRIRLVADNIEQVEGKINDQIIVTLTKYIKKFS